MQTSVDKVLVCFRDSWPPAAQTRVVQEALYIISTGVRTRPSFLARTGRGSCRWLQRVPVKLVKGLFWCWLPSSLFALYHVLPNSAEALDMYAGTELYPRIGKHFDIKVWTNCRMGLMSWGLIILCFAAKQYEIYGFLADSMLVSVLLMQVYIFKFFL